MGTSEPAANSQLCGYDSLFVVAIVHAKATIPPALFGPIAELAAPKQSWTCRIGRAVTKPLGMIKRMLYYRTVVLSGRRP